MIESQGRMVKRGDQSYAIVCIVICPIMWGERILILFAYCSHHLNWRYLERLSRCERNGSTNGWFQQSTSVAYIKDNPVNLGAEYLTEPSKANGDNGNGGNANSADEDIDESSRLLGGQMESQEAEFRRSELSFLAVKTTCAKLLPVRNKSQISYNFARCLSLPAEQRHYRPTDWRTDGLKYNTHWLTDTPSASLVVYSPRN